MKAKRHWEVDALVVVAIFVIMAYAVISFSRRGGDNPEAYNTYRGGFESYRVTIDETKEDDQRRYMVHLEPANGYDEPHPAPFAITGHDYDGDGQFDRIFIRITSSDGSNAITFTGKGVRNWEPCIADEGEAQPFTDAQVALAQAKLYQALSQVYNTEHQVVATVTSTE